MSKNKPLKWKIKPYRTSIKGELNNKWWGLNAGQFTEFTFRGRCGVPSLKINLCLEKPHGWCTPNELLNNQTQLCIDWMFHNIFLKIESLNYNSLGVLLRIFTGMLMKCDVDITFLQHLHGAIASALWKLYWDNRVKDLPFQGISCLVNLYSLKR